MIFAGIDGCKDGWVITKEVNGEPETEVVSELRDFVKEISETAHLLIDIPVGLPDTRKERNVEVQARKYLAKEFKSTVFTPPCRDAVYAKTYEEALDINQEQLNQKISKQSWNLCKKIAEVDRLLYPSPASNINLHEAHPETIFKFLNRERDLQHKKKTEEGVKERLDILQKYFDDSTAYLQSATDKLSDSTCSADDIIDSMALYAVSKSGIGVYKSFQGSETYDSRGLLMKICYGY